MTFVQSKVHYFLRYYTFFYLESRTLWPKMNLPGLFVTIQNLEKNFQTGSPTRLKPEVGGKTPLWSADWYETPTNRRRIKNWVEWCIIWWQWRNDWHHFSRMSILVDFSFFELWRHSVTSWHHLIPNSTQFSILYRLV